MLRADNHPLKSCLYMASVRRHSALAIATVLVAGALGGCGTQGQNPDFTVYDQKDQRVRDRYGTIWGGKDGVTVFSTEKPKTGGATADGGGGVVAASASTAICGAGRSIPSTSCRSPRRIRSAA